MREVCAIVVNGVLERPVLVTLALNPRTAMRKLPTIIIPMMFSNSHIAIN